MIDPKKARTRTLVEGDATDVELEWLEEMVVRMRRGLSEDGEHRLEFRGRRHPQALLKLALLEGDALAWLARREEESLPTPSAASEPEVDQELKAKILARLSGETDS